MNCSNRLALVLGRLATFPPGYLPIWLKYHANSAPLPRPSSRYERAQMHYDFVDRYARKYIQTEAEQIEAGRVEGAAIYQYLRSKGGTGPWRWTRINSNRRKTPLGVRYFKQTPINRIEGGATYELLPSNNGFGPPRWFRTSPPPPNNNTTKLGIRRNAPKDWRSIRDTWDQLGLGEILSEANRKLIRRKNVPRVDETWLKWFPGDEAFLGEAIQIHHIKGTSFAIPLPHTRHVEAHRPGGFRDNPEGGPGRTG